MIPSFKPGIMSSNRIRAAGGGVDVTPNAVDWANVGSLTTTIATTSMQQITGISQSITLRISWTTSGGTVTLGYSLNSTNTYSQTASLTSSPTDITVSNNQWLGFRSSYVSGAGNVLTTFTITNVSDNNTTLDTVVLTVGSGSGG